MYKYILIHITIFWSPDISTFIRWTQILSKKEVSDFGKQKLDSILFHGRETLPLEHWLSALQGSPYACGKKIVIRTKRLKISKLNSCGPLGRQKPKNGWSGDDDIKRGRRSPLGRNKAGSWYWSIGLSSQGHSSTMAAPRRSSRLFGRAAL